jgi:hypothetical protein
LLSPAHWTFAKKNLHLLFVKSKTKYKYNSILAQDKDFFKKQKQTAQLFHKTACQKQKKARKNGEQNAKSASKIEKQVKINRMTYF